MFARPVQLGGLGELVNFISQKEKTGFAAALCTKFV